MTNKHTPSQLVKGALFREANRNLPTLAQHTQSSLRRLKKADLRTLAFNAGLLLPPSLTKDQIIVTILMMQDARE